MYNIFIRSSSSIYEHNYVYSNKKAFKKNATTFIIGHMVELFFKKCAYNMLCIKYIKI